MLISNKTNYILEASGIDIPPGETCRAVDAQITLYDMVIHDNDGPCHFGLWFDWETPQHLIVSEFVHPPIEPLQHKTRHIQFDKIQLLKNLTNYVITTQEGNVILPQTEEYVTDYGEFMPFIKEHFWSSPDGTIAQAGPL